MAGLCPSWNSDDVIVESFLPGGYRNRNYRINHRGQRYVLRLAAAIEEHELDASDHANEIARLAALAGVFPRERTLLKLNVPLLEAADPSTGALLTHWCEYPLLAHSTGISAESLGAYLAELHAVLQRLPDSAMGLSTAPPAGLGEVSAMPHTPVRSAILSDLLAATSAAETLFAQLPPASDHLQPCHIDLNPWNLLVHDNHWVTLDWEVMGLADPLFDLVTLCDGYLREQGLVHLTSEFAEAALVSYNASAACERHAAELDVARQEYRWREYAWAEAQIAGGNCRAEVVQQRDDYALLLRNDGFDVVTRQS